MSTYVLMKILEGAPSRYEKGIRILTFGRLDRAYDRLTSQIKKGQRILDLGCGTGALTLRAGRRGARVKGIDINPQMLDIARERVVEANLSPTVELCEMGVAELGGEEPGSYDVVMGGLCFSELTEDELLFALKQVKIILKPEGLLLIADEVRPKSVSKRLLNWAIRVPLVVITYLISQTSAKAVRNLPEKIQEAGLVIESVRLSKLGDFMELEARKPQGGMK